VASVHDRYGKRGVQVVGVHTPEFDQERDHDLLLANVKTLGVRYPVVIDNDYKMWDALGNQAWPSLYLVDARGRIRLKHEGEIHAGEQAAREIEQAIDALLAEASAAPNRR
jgi:alkyl hydroperoxide reductase subunit AhpC